MRVKNSTAGRFPTKKGTIYLILILLFTLLIVGDVVNYVRTPAQNVPSFSGGRPEGMDFSESGFPEMGESGSFTLPDFDRMEMPSESSNTTGQSRRPQGEMPDFASFSNGQSSGSVWGSRLRSAFWPVLLVSSAADLLCIVFYLRSRKKRDEEEQLTQTEPDAPEDSDEPPRRKKLWPVPVAIVLTIALIVAMLPSGASDTGSSVSVTTKVISGTAEPATIRTSISGAGTLAADETQVVSVPSVMDVKCYHVRNGDVVEEGAILASADPITVASAITELKTVLEELDADLASETSGSNGTTITAPISGRVKQIYTSVGQKAAETVVQSGALMVLSLDGLMELRFPSEELRKGNSVTVQLSDGTTQIGTVAHVQDGEAMVTLSDEKAAPGATAAVLDDSGRKLGEGTLCIHSPWNVVNYYGTVSSIPVSVGQKVPSGTTLLYLKDTGHTDTYYSLLSRRQELEEQMEDLFEIYRDGYIRAEVSGIVTGVPADAEIVSLAANQEKVTAKPLAGTDDGIRIVFLADIQFDTEQDDATEQEEDTQTPPIPEHPQEINPEQGNEPETPPAEEPSIEPSTEPTAPSPGNQITGYVAKIAMISGSVIGVYRYPDKVQISDYSGIGSLSGLNMTEYVEYDYYELSISVALSELQEGMILFFDDSGSVICAGSGGNPQGPGGGGMPGGMPGGGMSGGSGGSFGGQSTQKTPAYEEYSTARQDVLTLISQENMVIEILVDELDILSLICGMEAQVTLDAMKGQAFDGIVSKIGQTGTNSGGNTKYTVEVTILKGDKMLSGMNASVMMETSATEAAVTIPLAALVEQDGNTYVYTGYSDKTDTLTGLTQVETGSSDGTTVEIRSGLSAGDPYYYRYAESIDYRFTRIL